MDIFKISLITPYWGTTTLYNGETEQNEWLGNWYWGYIELDGAFSQVATKRGHCPRDGSRDGSSRTGTFVRAT
jgi:hypothetical protein